MSTDDFRRSEGTYGFVKCIDGKMVVGFNEFNSKAKKLLESWEACGFKKCIEKHEQHHIAQCESKSPDVCKDKHSEKDILYIVSATTSCLLKLECWAMKAELSCFLSQFEENEKQQNIECRGAAKSYIEQLEKFAKANECDFAELQAKLEEAKRILN